MSILIIKLRIHLFLVIFLGELLCQVGYYVRLVTLNHYYTPNSLVMNNPTSRERF